MSSNTNTEAPSSVLDWMMWVVVVALVAGGIYGNWYYQDQSLFNRVLVIVLMTVVAVLIAAQTVRGKAIWLLLKEARIEIRRVVWPTRPETTQTTFIVLALVLVFALILWALDSGLSFLVSTVIG